MSKKRSTKRSKSTQEKTSIPVQEVAVVKCPKCGSIEREPYHTTKTLRFGKKVVTWRRTQCRDCGQRRIDKSIVDEA